MNPIKRNRPAVALSTSSCNHTIGRFFSWLSPSLVTLVGHLERFRAVPSFVRAVSVPFLHSAMFKHPSLDASSSLCVLSNRRYAEEP